VEEKYLIIKSNKILKILKNILNLIAKYDLKIKDIYLTLICVNRKLYIKQTNKIKRELKEIKFKDKKLENLINSFLKKRISLKNEEGKYILKYVKSKDGFTFPFDFKYANNVKFSKNNNTNKKVVSKLKNLLELKKWKNN